MKPDCELIIVDDGSEPELIPRETVKYNLKMLYTHDKNPWTNWKARNIGAKEARGEYLFFTDIDHVITKKALDAVLVNSLYSLDLMRFRRGIGTLDENGKLVPTKKTRKSHVATFVIKKKTFEMLGGYCEFGLGICGGATADFMARYTMWAWAGKLSPHCVIGPKIYVFPDDRDRELFHNLPRSDEGYNWKLQAQG